MKNEADFKNQIKKSVRYAHGCAISLAAPMLVGIPDLYVVVPEYIPILLEAKWLGKISRDKFSRKVPFTDMQIHWLKECHNVSPYSAMGLIGFIYKDKIHAVLVPYGTPHFYQITNSFTADCAYATLDATSNAKFRHFDIMDLFSRVPIPEIARAPKEPSIYAATAEQSLAT